jgi:hypothetical protein
LGGGEPTKDIADNKVPGPGTHNPKELYHPPGFRIVPPTNSKADKQGSQDDFGKEKSEPVGPQRYFPNYPTHVEKGVKIGTGTREDP